MAKREHYSGFQYNQGFAPIILTADQDGVGVDTRGFDSTTIIFNVGITGDTLSSSVYLELEVEDSPDNSTWTDCADADLTNVTSETTNNTGTVALINANAEDQAVFATGYIGDKRYVRGVVNITGTHTNGIEVGIIIINGHAHITPVNAPS